MNWFLICFCWLLAIMFIFLAVTVLLWSIKREVRPWLTASMVVAFCAAALICLLVSWSGLTRALEPTTTAAASDLTPKEDYFYRVRWEGSTKDGKTFLLAEDSKGKLYYAEISQPLGIKEIPVMKEEKFKELFPAPKNPAKTGK